MRENFYAELSRRLREEGIESSYAGTQNLNVLLHGQPVLCVTPSSEIFILPAGSKNEEVNDLYHRVGATADEVYEYVEAVQSSPLLRASDLKEEFRLLADFGCAVLAGRERENGRGYQFVTWVWDFDRRGVTIVIWMSSMITANMDTCIWNGAKVCLQSKVISPIMAF